MFVAENLIVAVAKVINLILTLYMWIIIARALVSWVNPDPYNPIVRFLYRATEPVLAPLRRLIPFRTGGLDLSPILVLLIIFFLQEFLVRTLIQAAVRF
ncbi:MAG TPA: YggT family protein [Syntrophales bacterium]|nr:YggT family protein [Syntrophales bacterium]